MSSAASATTSIDEVRAERRTHLFVAATLCADERSTPVNIRNMSPTGALIESSALPAAGTVVTLKRGSLEIAGRIAWKAGRKGGIAFCSAIRVAQWMSRMSGGDQQRVDKIVSDYKAGTSNAALPAAADGCGDTVTAELLVLRTELAQLGDDLIGDMALVAAHPEIQTLDIALQRVDRLIARLRPNS